MSSWYDALGHNLWAIIEAQHKTVADQKWDPNHERLTKEVIDEWAPLIPKGRVLDIGYGSGLAKKHWERHGFEWLGIELPDDMHYFEGKDFPYHENNLVYARHVLEHSPFPALALEHWSNRAPQLIVVVPEPSSRSIRQQGHLSVWPRHSWTTLFNFLDLEVVEYRLAEYNNPPPWPQGGAEYRFLLRAK